MKLDSSQNPHYLSKSKNTYSNSEIFTELEFMRQHFEWILKYETSCFLLQVISENFKYQNHFIKRVSFHGSDFYLKQKYTISPASSMLSVTFRQIYAQYKNTMNKDEVIVSNHSNIVGFRELSFYIFHKCLSITSPIIDTTNNNVIGLIFDRHVLFAWNQFSSQCLAQKHFLFKVRVNLKQLTICIWIINISIIDSLKVWLNFSLIQFYKAYLRLTYNEYWFLNEHSEICIATIIKQAGKMLLIEEIHEKWSYK